MVGGVADAASGAAARLADPAVDARSGIGEARTIGHRLADAEGLAQVRRDVMVISARRIEDVAVDGSTHEAVGRRLVAGAAGVACHADAAHGAGSQVATISRATAEAGLAGRRGAFVLFVLVDLLGPTGAVFTHHAKFTIFVVRVRGDTASAAVASLTVGAVGAQTFIATVTRPVAIARLAGAGGTLAFQILIGALAHTSTAGALHASAAVAVVRGIADTASSAVAGLAEATVGPCCQVAPTSLVQRRVAFLAGVGRVRRVGVEAHATDETGSVVGRNDAGILPFVTGQGGAGEVVFRANDIAAGDTPTLVGIAAFVTVAIEWIGAEAMVGGIDTSALTVAGVVGAVDPVVAGDLLADTAPGQAGVFGGAGIAVRATLTIWEVR